jgi:chemotaxis protein CheD
MQHTVSISDAKVSNATTDTLVTYSLGSCIGVAVWDPQVPCAGLLHFQLPTGSLDPERAKSKPLMFGDTGLTWLISEMEKKGASRKRMKVKLAGGAKMFEDKSSTFDIGKRNHTAIRKALWQLGLFVASEEVGGAVPRTVYQNVGDGKTILKRSGETVEL